MENQISRPRIFIILYLLQIEIGDTYAKTDKSWIAQLENKRLRSSKTAKRIEQVPHGPNEKSYSKD